MLKKRLLLLLFFILPVCAQAVQLYAVKVVDKKPLARQHFVQGLEIVDGYLYISSGQYGKSRLVRYPLQNPGTQLAKNLNADLFAEGLTVLKDRVYQLTWRNNVMLVYRKEDFQPLGTLPVVGEGWGLTNNGSELIYSDGTEHLRVMSPETGAVLRTITVREGSSTVSRLNELEWIDGSIWANIWHSERIVIIDPLTGNITASIDLQGLLPASERHSNTDVLNGIAHNPVDGSIWVTGKYWPWLYSIELLPAQGPETQQQR